MERTLIILKPDAVARRLTGRIIQRFEDKGLVVAAMKMMRISRDLAERHYAPHKGKPFYPGLIDYITSGPVVVVVLRGQRAIGIARTLMGATFGYEAEPGTIRGDFSASRPYNLVHGSDSPESAASEIYSLGMVLYYATMGENYFSAKEVMQIARQHVRQARLSSKDHKMKDVSPDIAAIIDKMIKRDIDQRYQSFLEVERDVLRVLRDRLEQHPKNLLLT